MPPAARMLDNVLQTAPHCHAPIHPPAPTPTPVPHPAIPLPILTPCAPTVLIGKMPAARVTDTTKICTLIPCVPAGPGIIVKGSTTVLVQKMPAARAGDMTSHPTCVAPIPSPTGNIIPPCCVTVQIGG
ncbi:MAG: PAAR domain-containing protein [Pseudomonadota bacterium]